MYKYVYTFIINMIPYGILKYSLLHLQMGSSFLWNKMYNSTVGKGVNVYILYSIWHSTFACKTNKKYIWVLFGFLCYVLFISFCVLCAKWCQCLYPFLIAPSVFANVYLVRVVVCCPLQGRHVKHCWTTFYCLHWREYNW